MADDPTTPPGTGDGGANLYMRASDHLPSWLVNLIWPRFCSRHDRAVTRWHYRRCKHPFIVLDEVITGEIAAAGNQLYGIARIAYRLSREGDQVMSLGQRDTMFYALQRWERASRLAGKPAKEKEWH